MRWNASTLQRFNASTPHAFTLIEVIGVLAVMALVAVAVIPQVIKRIDQAASTKEKADLDGMAESFTQYILRNKAITNEAGIAPTIANEMAQPLNAITDNSRHYSRAFLIDPGFRMNGAPPPYTQSTNGAVKPVSPRVMFVSSLHRQLPGSITAGGLTATEFTNIWDTPEGAIPSGATWSAFSSTDDVHIKKINLEPLFHRLVLINRDPDILPGFSIDGSSPPTGVITNRPSLDRYYLEGSIVGLHDPVGVPVTKHLLSRDISFVFERNNWTGWIGAGDPISNYSDEFARQAGEFLGADWNQQARRGSSQTGVLVTMYVFMFDYALWAEECPHFDRHGLGGVLQVPEYLILEEVGGKSPGDGVLWQASADLLNR